MALPLDGIRILDWTVMQQGPIAVMMLADLGAEVIKIEERVRGDPGRGIRRYHGVTPPLLDGGRTYYFESFDRGRRGIVVDVKKERGREIIYRLVERSDVFVQNFRAGAAARSGLDYATLSRYNPRLIYASGTGFGSRGPDSVIPAFDGVAQARSGFVTEIGDPGTPPLLGTMGMSDQVGAIILAYGILAALMARERTGIGQEIEVSLFGSTIFLQAITVAHRILLGQTIPRASRSNPGNALYNYYRCKDDKWLFFGMTQSQRFWHDFCHVLGIEELEHDPRFKDDNNRAKNSEELVSILDKLFTSKTREEWMRILRKGGDFVYAPVNTMADLEEDPQVIANEYFIDFEHPTLGKIKMMSSPVKFSKMSVGSKLPAPELGQHTEEVLLEIVYTWDDIVQLKDEEVI